MNPPTRPSVLCVYYSYTQQTKKVMTTMASEWEDRGCEVTLAAITFDDPKYIGRFSEFPMRRPFREVVAMIPAVLRHRPAVIGIPAEVTAKSYDFVCIGSPTWWLSTNVPVHSFLQSAEAATLLNGTPFTAAVCCRRYWRHNLKSVMRLGTIRGGTPVDGIHFRYQGGQVRSLLSLISYLGTGEYRRTYLGVRIPPTNLIASHLDEAKSFAEALVPLITSHAKPA